MFADTGIPAFLKALMDLGAKFARMKAVMAGGAKVLDQSGAFNIGQQNYQIAKSIIAANQVPIHYEDIGGIQSRTLRLDMGRGISFINLPDGGEIKI
jgi:chemotaxis protein CheD